MSQLTDLINAYPPPVLAKELLANPFWSGLNMLWRSPDHIAPMCDFFGLTAVAEAEAFAASLNDGTGWVAHQAKLSQWLNPRPGVWLEDMEPVPWQQVSDILVSGAVPTMDPYWVQPNDGTVYLPTVAQLTTIMANCPARRFAWKANDLDCDDHVRILRGWLSEHGLGPVAVGFGGYRVFNASGVDIGAHAIGLAICTDRKPWIGEPRDGKVYPITKVNLGGFIFAHHVAYTLAQF